MVVSFQKLLKNLPQDGLRICISQVYLLEHNAYQVPTLNPFSFFPFFQLFFMSPNFDSNGFRSGKPSRIFFTMTFAYLLSFKFSNLREGWETGRSRLNRTLEINNQFLRLEYVGSKFIVFTAGVYFPATANYFRI